MKMIENRTKLAVLAAAPLVAVAIAIITRCFHSARLGAEPKYEQAVCGGRIHYGP